MAVYKEYFFCTPNPSTIEISKKLGIDRFVILTPGKETRHLHGLPNLEFMPYKIGLSHSESGIIAQYDQNNYTRLTNSIILLDRIPDLKLARLNDKICALFKERKLTYAISLKLIINSYSPSIFNLISFNLRLCKKFKIPVIISSFSDSSYDLRSPKDIQSFKEFLEKAKL